MRPFLVAVALATLLGTPARAGRILFATEASLNAVDGFCVGKDGSLASGPTVRIATAAAPRRLVVKANPTTGTDGVLYIAEADRVEAFRIMPRGDLKRVGGIADDPNMNPLDVAVSDDGRTLYVPQNGPHRIAAYPLDADGGPIGDFASCINGPIGPRYQRLLLRDGLLYVSAAILGGRISVFPVGADGSLPVVDGRCAVDRTRTCTVDEDCPTGLCGTCRKTRGVQQETCPLAERRKLLTPGPFVITSGGVLHVESLSQRRIVTFQLVNGLFESARKKKTGEPIDICLNEKADEPEKEPFAWQKPLGKTAQFQQYHDIALHPLGEVVIGSQFTHGRVDAYRIKSSLKLPKHPTRRTEEDPRQSPVGIAVTDDTLYVAAGEFDRVRAFRLRRSTGILASRTPFSETEERKGSFPNAVALADLSDVCR